MSAEIDRIARSVAPEVLAAAVERAREQSIARLADALTEAIVSQALAGPDTRPGTPLQPDTGAGEAAPVAPPAEPAESAADGFALYAYGITLADLPLPPGEPALTGRSRLERVAVGDLALLVSRVVPDELQVDEEDLSETGRLATLARAHDAVVRAAAGAGPVLPLRFGTVVPDEPAARRLLDEHGESARAQLRRIGNNREWGVKLLRRMEAPAAVGGPAERIGVTGTEYLARRQQALHEREAGEQTARQASELVMETLRRQVTESVHRGGSPGSSLLLDLAFLVPPEGESGFLAAAAQARERLEPDGLEVEVSGPWPPYSFVTLGTGDA